MTLSDDFGLAPREDDEGLFSRDIDGQLVRLDAPTDEDYKTKVRMQVNGRLVQVPMAKPLTDAEGNIVLDMAGRSTPRYTTILDAIVELNSKRTAVEEEISVPTLCHQPHMLPVAVCRLCVVQVYGSKRGKRTPERKLLPSCQQQVKDGMEVFTKDAPGADGDRVRRSVSILTELLIADHLKSSLAPADIDELTPCNELQEIANRCSVNRSRFDINVMKAGSLDAPVIAPRAGRRTLDSSSPVFLVDHSACILCDRCSRACNEVKKNYVIGRTGKGVTAGIGFDLNDKMFESSCVQCGECMVSCPTFAITFKPLKRIRSSAGAGVEIVSLPELKNDPLFAGVPTKFLLWQTGLVHRRILKDGDVLCRNGEPGHSAFIIKRGQLQVTPPGAKPILRTAEDVIVGEMACLSGMPRNADVCAVGDAEIWEVRRNVLDRMMRSPTQRDLFEPLYRDRALASVLRRSEFLLGLPPDEYNNTLALLKSRLGFVRVKPGQTIFHQGELADYLYLIRLGHVRIGISRYGQEVTVLYKGPGTVIGEIGLVALSREDAGKSLEEIDGKLSAVLAGAAGGNLSAALPAGERTATCSALDHVELARVNRSVFLDAIRQYPTFRANVIKMALNRLSET